MTDETQQDNNGMDIETMEASFPPAMLKMGWGIAPISNGKKSEMRTSGPFNLNLQEK